MNGYRVIRMGGQILEGPPTDELVEKALAAPDEVRAHFEDGAWRYVPPDLVEHYIRELGIDSYWVHVVPITNDA